MHSKVCDADVVEFPVRVPRQSFVQTGEYDELRRSVKLAGLLEKQPSYYAIKIVVAWIMFAIGWAMLALPIRYELYLIDAVYLAFVSTQIGFLGHDAAHGQIFRRGWTTTLFSLIHGNLLLGLSYGWWTQKHNQHHMNPNCLDSDPDLDIPTLAFTEEQALKKKGFLRILAKYQAYFFVPVLFLTVLGQRVQSIEAIARGKVRHPRVEAIFLIIHGALYLGFIFFLLGTLRGSLFILLHQGLFGFYIGSTFAPNHKGMMTLESGSQTDFLYRQVLTARNVAPSVIADFWYGGLNYQIEHHLFPNMPRNQFRKAREIVMEFCRNHAIPYKETTVMRSYRETLLYLHNVSAVLKRARQVNEPRPSLDRERQIV